MISRKYREHIRKLRVDLLQIFEFSLAAVPSRSLLGSQARTSL